MKLTCEIVPKTSWYSNVRSEVSKEEWDCLRKYCYKLAKNKCQICGDIGIKQGYNNNVECHEIWEYDDEKLIQKLVGLIALCPYCHKVKHPGLAKKNDEFDIVINQLMRINNISYNKAINHIINSFEIYEKRSLNNYSIDISFLDNYLNN